MSYAVDQHVSTTTFRIINNVSEGVKENCSFSFDEIHESRKGNFFETRYVLNYTSFLYI
jgi:hypothetical protein